MSLHDEYQAIRESAAIGSISPRSQLGVAGNDRASYLQGLLTNDIQALTPGTGCYAAWLTPQGRMLTDLHVLESAGMILLDVPAEQAQTTLQRLDQFLFSEDVQLQSLVDAMRGVWVHGPGAAAVLERALQDGRSGGPSGPFDAGAAGLDAWAQYQHTRLELAGEPVSVARIDQLGVPGFCVFLDPSRERQLVAALQAAGAHVVGAEALTAARIEAGYPVFGVDMNDTTIPLEAGIETRAVSFTKGCYVGQEIIIRVLHRGGGRVAKKLVALRVAGPVPAPGARLFAGAREVGHVTSAAESPRTGAIALGYVHRDFIAPGTELGLDDSSVRPAATVTANPIA
jgi:folate-binding protein YgfZ